MQIAAYELKLIPKLINAILVLTTFPLHFSNEITFHLFFILWKHLLDVNKFIQRLSCSHSICAGQSSEYNWFFSLYMYLNITKH